MAVPASKRSTMSLYSSPNCPYCHQVRIVLAEKGVTAEIININLDKKPEELFALNPYGSVPTLVDRDLVLFKSNIIMEYLDERFPHPPLMPVYPVARAKTRLMMYRVEKDWYSLMMAILHNDTLKGKEARKDLQDSLISIAPLFASTPFFLSEEFSLLDCTLAPLLWRLLSLGIDLGAKGKAIKAYTDRIFARSSFKASLSETEEDLR